jgi:threonine/homoserine/homoserine lactone efflux protein
MFLGAAALIFLGWLTWDAAGSSQRRSVRRSPDA